MFKIKFPYIVKIKITIDYLQKQPTRCSYVFKCIIPCQLYMFQATFSTIIRSSWLYLQYLVIFTNVAAGWCHRCVGVPTHAWHQLAATLVNITRYCKYSYVLLMMGKNIPRNKYSWQEIINLHTLLYYCHRVTTQLQLTNISYHHCEVR